MTGMTVAAVPEHRPRHAMVVHAVYPLGETRVQREAEALVAAGYEVDVLCLRQAGEPAHEVYRGVSVHRLPVGLEKASLLRQLGNWLHFGARAAAMLARLHRRAPYQSVQVHNLPDFLVYAALAPRRDGVPVILDLHDLMPEFFAGRFGSGHPWAARAVTLQERLACRFADHVVTVSDHWRDALVARGVPGQRCSVVPNVADEALFRPRARRPDHDRFQLLYHGTITHRYGLDLAVEAVAMLADELPDLHLTILGRGDAVDSLRSLRDGLGLQDRVDIPDELVLASDLPPIIADADLAVVPYRDDPFTDGLLPTKLMEYAAMGVPAVAAGTTAIRRHFEGTMVELFTPGDAVELAARIRALHDDPSRLAALAAGSEDFRRRHAWSDVAADYVALVAGLGARGPGAARRDLLHPAPHNGARVRTTSDGGREDEPAVASTAGTGVASGRATGAGAATPRDEEGVW